MVIKGFSLIVAVSVALCDAGVVRAADIELPATLSWSSYQTGTTGYTQTVAIARVLREAYGVNLIVVPGKDDLSRMSALRNGKAAFAVNGSGTFFGFEGVFHFGVPDLGPQDVRLLASATPDANLQLGVTKTSGIRKYSDLKGKRVARVRGSPALLIGTEAMLAFGGLSWDDVIPVDFSSFDAAWAGMVKGGVDAAFASTVSGATKKLAASPRGIFWPNTPHGDREGWKRLQAVAPYFRPHIATTGSGITARRSNEGAAYPFPILITYKGQASDELVYSMTRAIHEQLENLIASEPAAAGWALKNQTFQWAVPYHDAAIKYWAEAGLWTGAMQMHNDRLIDRADVLAAAWKKMKALGVSKGKFRDKWMSVRAATLTAAGFNPIWK